MENMQVNNEDPGDSKPKFTSLRVAATDFRLGGGGDECAGTYRLRWTVDIDTWKIKPPFGRNYKLKIEYKHSHVGWKEVVTLGEEPAVIIGRGQKFWTVRMFPGFFGFSENYLEGAGKGLLKLKQELRFTIFVTDRKYDKLILTLKKGKTIPYQKSNDSYVYKYKVIVNGILSERKRKEQTFEGLFLWHKSSKPEYHFDSTLERRP